MKNPKLAQFSTQCVESPMWTYNQFVTQCVANYKTVLPTEKKLVSFIERESWGSGYGD